jgi:hypothetical protein
VTSTPRLGNVGLAQLNADCKTAFPGARMCRDRDLAEVFPAPDPSKEAWILVVPSGPAGSRTATSYGDALTTKELNCTNYTYANLSPAFTYSVYWGVALVPGGALKAFKCNTSRVVACCGY